MQGTTLRTTSLTRSTSWQHLAIREKVASSSRRQLPRTKLGRGCEEEEEEEEEEV